MIIDIGRRLHSPGHFNQFLSYEYRTVDTRRMFVIFWLDEMFELFVYVEEMFLYCFKMLLHAKENYLFVIETLLYAIKMLPFAEEMLL